VPASGGARARHAQRPEQPAHLVERGSAGSLDPRECPARCGRVRRELALAPLGQPHDVVDVHAYGTVELARQSGPLDLDSELRGLCSLVLERKGACSQLLCRPSAQRDEPPDAPDPRTQRAEQDDRVRRDEGVGEHQDNHRGEHGDEAAYRCPAVAMASERVRDQQRGRDRDAAAPLVERRDRANDGSRRKRHGRSQRRAATPKHRQRHRRDRQDLEQPPDIVRRCRAEQPQRGERHTADEIDDRRPANRSQCRHAAAPRVHRAIVAWASRCRKIHAT